LPQGRLNFHDGRASAPDGGNVASFTRKIEIRTTGKTTTLLGLQSMFENVERVKLKDKSLALWILGGAENPPTAGDSQYCGERSVRFFPPICAQSIGGASGKSCDPCPISPNPPANRPGFRHSRLQAGARDRFPKKEKTCAIKTMGAKVSLFHLDGAYPLKKTGAGDQVRCQNQP